MPDPHEEWLASSTVERLIDDLAQRIGYNVIREPGVTGYQYVLMNKNDTWFYVLNQGSFDGTEH